MKMEWNGPVNGFVVLLVLGLVSVPGCGNHGDDQGHPNVTSVKAEELGHNDDDAESGHSHAAGAHGGEVLIIGDHAAHVEVVHDGEQGKIVFHVTDGAMKENLVIDTPLLLNIKTPSGPKQITTKRIAGTAAYEAESPDLKTHALEGQVVVALEGKKYYVSLPAHDHDHGGAESSDTEKEDDDHDHDGEESDHDHGM
ncbi:MAG: hypothetical protein ABIK28_12790 [Planctomycetota bacterium]